MPFANKARRKLYDAYRSHERRSGNPPRYSFQELEDWIATLHMLCNYCGHRLDGNRPWVFDHYLPLARRPDAGVSNIVMACAACNEIKGDLTGEEFKDLMEVTGRWPDDVRLSFFARLRRGAIRRTR
jgi:5-methylcytosine-specific restriction endonuclease McrA